ncbi:MAG: acetylxylan esterase, partial [SAR324 cluster bacterium]|nr:acetylxylan esterase [SAR324 cluster bacterium]
MKSLSIIVSLLLLISPLFAKDIRDSSPKDLNGFFPFDPPSTLKEWETRKEKLVLRMQVATGLYPMPIKTPLNAVIHGKINRPGFTVEK